MTKKEILAKLAHAEARAIKLAAENDSLRHALEISKANERLVWNNGARPAQIIQRVGFQRTAEQEAARQLAMQTGRAIKV